MLTSLTGVGFDLTSLTSFNNFIHYTYDSFTNFLYGEVFHSDDSLFKLLESWDLAAARNAISGLVRAMGFGPEADGIATFIVGFFILLVIIGYAAGPKNTDQNVTKDTNEKK